jgi:hypothetical protein
MTNDEFESGVKRWHESSSTLDIWEFLRMSREQYERMVTGETLCPHCGTTPLPDHGCKCQADWLAANSGEHTIPASSRDLVKVVRCADCKHGGPDEMGDGSSGIICDVWFYHDSPRGRQKCWPINALDHFCAKGERKA